MKTTKSDLFDQSEDALIDILLTVDGQGREVKGAALSELLRRVYRDGCLYGQEAGVSDSGSD